MISAVMWAFIHEAYDNKEPLDLRKGSKDLNEKENNE